MEFPIGKNLPIWFATLQSPASCRRTSFLQICKLQTISFVGKGTVKSSNFQYWTVLWAVSAVSPCLWRMMGKATGKTGQSAVLSLRKLRGKVKITSLFDKITTLFVKITTLFDKITTLFNRIFRDSAFYTLYYCIQKNNIAVFLVHFMDIIGRNITKCLLVWIIITIFAAAK